MPDDKMADGSKDEVLECIYIGGHFRDDAGWLENLFDMCSKTTAASNWGPRIHSVNQFNATNALLTLWRRHI